MSISTRELVIELSYSARRVRQLRSAYRRGELQCANRLNCALKTAEDKSESTTGSNTAADGAGEAE